MRPMQMQRHADGLIQIEYHAMASVCQVLLDAADWQQAAQVATQLAQETWRIEQKYSRYRSDSVIGHIHQQTECWVKVDAESARLFDFAETLYQLSEGMFDISSGVLGKIWRFDGSDQLPSQAQIDTLLPYIGWHKVQWDSAEQRIFVPQGMTLDLGGIGKEYAVDCCAELLQQQFDGAYLINFGGDLRARGPRTSGQAWQIGLEQPDCTVLASSTSTPDAAAQHAQTLAQFSFNTGAMATSGDAKRFVLKAGVRYGHILNPKTGWPVQGAPRSITVHASNCVQAGMLATLAMLQGRNASDFLQQQAAGQAWIVN